MARLCIRRNTGKTSINGSGISAISYIPIFIPAEILIPTEAFAFAQTSVLAPGLPKKYINKDQ